MLKLSVKVHEEICEYAQNNNLDLTNIIVDELIKWNNGDKLLFNLEDRTKPIETYCVIIRAKDDRFKLRDKIGTIIEQFNKRTDNIPLKEPILENRFIRIDFSDNDFGGYVEEASKRVVSEILNGKSADFLYIKFREDIKTHGLDNFKNRIVHSTYLVDCLEKTTSPYSIKNFDIKKTFNTLSYLDSLIEVILEKEQTIFD